VGKACLSMQAQSENAAGYADGRLGCFERGCIGIPVLLE